MRVLLQRERRVLVAKSLADHFGWDSSAESDSRVRMPQVVQANSWKVSFVHDALKGLRVSLGVKRSAVLFAHNEVVVFVIASPSKVPRASSALTVADLLT